MINFLLNLVYTLFVENLTIAIELELLHLSFSMVAIVVKVSFYMFLVYYFNALRIKYFAVTIELELLDLTFLMIEKLNNHGSYHWELLDVYLRH